jgi:hypothetical protein
MFFIQICSKTYVPVQLEKKNEYNDVVGTIIDTINIIFR